MLNVIKKIFGTSNDRQLKRLTPAIKQINALEESISGLSNEELRGKTEEFRRLIQESTAAERQEAEEARQAVQDQPADVVGEEGQKLREALVEAEKKLYTAEGYVLDKILPEAFACVREASRRTIGLRHYDVQLLGGMILHQGKISEMKTGEGKTLVATLPLYLNSLSGRGVHLVTVNDYLARRDVQWMGPIFHLLGVSIASIVHDESFLFDPSHKVKDYRLLNLRPVERRDAYRADITYGTNHEFGFDYLRDNMKFALEEYVQRELTFAIVDEVDNILIDEARTPLIISGPAEQSTDKYYRIDRLVPRLKRGATVQGDVRQEDRAAIEAQGDYTVDEKSKSVTLTEQGVSKIERMLNIPNLYDPAQMEILHHVQQSLKAHTIFRRDVDYIVKDGQVIIVDEFTGRLMPGRRWSDGLHQAVEAKEGVRIERENQTLATITIQNYFRMYRKLGGMTGTADTEAPEFKKIYSLDVVVAPPNKIMKRIDHGDVVYKTEREKNNAVIEQIAECHEKGQPVLVGTVSVEKSEDLAKLLKKRGIRHNVLNAVNHEAEANIIAQAGRYAQVTIATNMAGRGTDILLGGNPEFLARSEMENEWVRTQSTMPEGSHRYEDILAKLRDEFEEECQRAQKEYEPLWKPFEIAQGEALEEITGTHREHLEAAYWAARGKYENALASLADGGASAAADCANAVSSYSDALIEIDRVTGPHFGEEGQNRFGRARDDFYNLLVEASQNGGSPVWQGARGVFERTRQDYERAVQRVFKQNGGDDAILNEVRTRHEDAERRYRAAEEGFAAHRQPYEAAITAARERYENERRKYTLAIEDMREQMESAPEETRGKYSEVLARYQTHCAEEREKVAAAGGLFIIGTERHESRRIDNQLRGRAGRQGDPGASRFFLSLEDDLLRIFGAERIQNLMERLGMEEGEAIEHKLINRAIANAQSKVEAHNFDIRKHLIEYDDVMNKQREVIYTKRREVLTGEHLKDHVMVMVDNLIGTIVDRYADSSVAPEEWDWNGLDDTLFGQFNMRLQFGDGDKENMTSRNLEEILHRGTRAAYEHREQQFGEANIRHLERFVLLQTIDQLWKEHLLHMDHLKEGIGLRGYAQKNPLQEYQKEGFAMFEEMIDRIETDSVQKLFTVQIVREEQIQQLEQKREKELAPQQTLMSGGGEPAAPIVRKPALAKKPEADRVGRNDPCPCGSGKKYKKCHGA